MSSRSPRALRFGSRSSSACNPLVLGNRAHGGLRDRDSMGLVRARDFELASILPRALLDPATAPVLSALGKLGLSRLHPGGVPEARRVLRRPREKLLGDRLRPQPHPLVVEPVVALDALAGEIVEVQDVVDEDEALQRNGDRVFGRAVEEDRARSRDLQLVAEGLHQPRVEPLAQALLARRLAVAVLRDVQGYVELAHEESDLLGVSDGGLEIALAEVFDQRLVGLDEPPGDVSRLLQSLLAVLAHRELAIRGKVGEGKGFEAVHFEDRPAEPAGVADRLGERDLVALVKAFERLGQGIDGLLDVESMADVVPRPPGLDARDPGEGDSHSDPDPSHPTTFCPKHLLYLSTSLANYANG